MIIVHSEKLTHVITKLVINVMSAQIISASAEVPTGDGIQVYVPTTNKEKFKYQLDNFGQI